MTQITNAPSSETPFVDPKTGRIARSWFQWLLGIISAATTGGDVTHTGTLADHHVVLGNGAADIRALAGSGTSGQILTSNGAAADPTFQAPATAGTVTHTGTLTAGKLIQGDGGADVTVNATTATVTKLTAGTPSAASAGTDYVAPGAITSDGITMSTARLLGRTTAATGAVEEITAGTGLTLSAGTLTATGSGGTVTTTGSPASGNLTKFSGAASITNADLTGDVTTSGGVATTLATVNANVGTFGDGTHVAQVTATGTGLITAISSVAITNQGTVTHTAGALTSGQLVYGNGSADLKTVAATNGQIPIGKTSDGTAALATLTQGTNITITNAANSITISATAGAGGTGNSIYSTAVGSEPGSPNAGDVDLYTNGAGPIVRYSGSTWPTWGPLFAFTNPSNGAFTWDNQGGASVDTTNGGVYLLAPTNSGDSIRYRYYAVPSTPYTIVMGYIPQMFGVNFQAMGFAWSDGTKFVCANTAANVTNAMVLSVTKFTNATTFSADYLGATTYSQYAPMAWLKCQDTGTNRIVSWSQDGQHWVQLHSVGRTDFLTATRIGFFANSNNTTWPAAMTLLSWLQT